MALFGCIADDFTGATDLAGILARSGQKVSLRIGIPDDEAKSDAAFEVIALKVRTAPLDDALAECGAALKWLRNAGASRFFWKYCSTFDSTPEGNIGPIAEMLMEELGAAQTIYCPAFPENGRTVYMGHLFVGEQLLSDSPMKDHPLTPMTRSDLVKVLSAQTRQKVGLARHATLAEGAGALRERLAELADGGTAHVIIDTIDDDDLATIAEACQDMPLMTGGSAIALTLPELWLGDEALLPDRGAFSPPETFGKAIVLSGSCSAMTNQQVAAFDRGPSLRLDPLELSEEGPQHALDWLDIQPDDTVPMIYATAAPDEIARAHKALGRDAAGRIVEEALSACAQHAFDTGTRRFVVAGGETSGAVTTALGVDQMDVGAEIAPGVPWCFSQSDGQPVALALKSGNFGNEGFFAQALDQLA